MSVGDDHTYYLEEVDIDDDDFGLNDASAYAEVAADISADDETDDDDDAAAGFAGTLASLKQEQSSRAKSKRAQQQSNSSGGGSVALPSINKQQPAARFPAVASPSAAATSSSSSSSPSSSSSQSSSSSSGQVRSRPIVIDDFIRNFFVKAGMRQSLEAFQSEWYDLKQRGEIDVAALGAVPDIYVLTDSLTERINLLQTQLVKANAVAERAKSTWAKFRKERDYHRMHHRRVTQEKDRLLVDLKRLQRHNDSYEPTLAQLRRKLEDTMKDKMLMRLERDRHRTKVSTLESQLAQIESSTGVSASSGTMSSQARARLARTPGGGPSLRGTASASSNSSVGASASSKRGGARGERASAAASEPRASQLPADERINPYLNDSNPPTAAAVHEMGLVKTFKGHSQPISCVALHPRKPIVATVSDDLSWKMWSVPNGEIVLSGDGHTDWLSSCEFHPSGSLLATSSGDGSVKLWDFMATQCAGTLADHSQAVWDLAFHDQGNFLVSASMDHTCKLWDLATGRCRSTLRGHVDSVNAVCFQPYSNNIATASGDKTVSMWDTRSGLCVQTFYDHANAALHCSFNLQGDLIASSDADGVVKVWDVRMVGERLHIDTSVVGSVTGDGGSTVLHAPVNQVRFDRSGSVLACASDNGAIMCYAADDGTHRHNLVGHDKAVHCVVFDPDGEYLISSGADSTFRIWSS